ncbi:BglII/BstYI family type II restriction endonuclease [Chloroflexus aggregans]|uniref:Restriction endonuclease BglII n=1 Tax=Chloroflexus aggregans (strain MD-66 / DSM 9485) TaxID=326427 RepID=B8GD59_CHLAD|nr:BglII/BstYI family type II restriction endonuclease [Chloroflexus aggregans]ACL25126.1 Restriction endonuclease BglII [Chloroflexus aggregans DSM 9485]
MIIAVIYSFNRGEGIIRSQYSAELGEVEQVIAAVDSTQCKTKTSREKTMPGRMLYSPRALNRAFTKEFGSRGWEKYKVQCDYSTEYYVPGYVPSSPSKGAFREIDFVKNRVGIEVQFGKYAFMVYNVCAKMTIFHKLGVIDVGIEIVPIKLFAEEMSTGVSYFEQFVWDLEHRGIADIDIPVLVLGVTT